MKKIALSLWILSIVVSIYGCKETKKDDNSNSQTKKIADSSNSQTKKIEERKITTDKKYNEMARYIAGLSQQENDELKKYEEDAAWKSYAQESDAKWSRLKKGKLLKMKNWAEEALKEPNQKGGLLFYPFSGADFLHAQTLFPDVDNVVMIGLEPIGTPLSVEKIAKKNTSYFSALNKAGYFLAEFSFFRTNDMAIDLTGKRSVEVDGTIHLIMLYLAQLDNEIINYEKIAINAEGKVVLANEYKNDDNKKVVYGNKIYFKKKADDKIRS
ncbi:MAG: hypothetical protein SFU27_14320, partial [Thermonemataceae bacterium]|nr:hypothetical protein [Thermonemataceae bacterium]